MSNKDDFGSAIARLEALGSSDTLPEHSQSEQMLDSIEALVREDLEEATVESLLRAKERVCAIFDDAISQLLAEQQ